MVKKVREEVYKRSKEKAVTQNWWDEDSDLSTAMTMLSDAKNLILFQAYRQKDYLNYSLMYGSSLGFSNMNLYQGPGLYSKTTATTKLRLNAVKACVESAQAKIAKNSPRPEFLTSNGDWAQKQKAKKLTQYLEGLFDETKMYAKGAEVFRDAAVNGTGAMYLKADLDTGKIVAENVWIEELIIDEAEAQYGTPRKLYRTKIIERSELAAMYPDHADAISMATSIVYASITSKDLIQVTYGWHLGTDKTKGKHCVAIAESCLLVEDYDKPCFPFAFFRYDNKGFRSFYGKGIGETLFPIQLEINQTCQTIQQALYFAAVPRVYLHNNSEVISQHVDNRVGGIVRYSGVNPPLFSTATASNPEMYNYLEYLWKKCFEQVGLSEMTSTSNKPAGLDAAVAMREYQDIESQRFAITSKAWEQFYLDIANIVVDLAKDLYEKGNDLAVKAKVGKFINSIKWSEVDLPEDSYVLRCFPVSILPSQPAGKLAFVQELIQGGFIDKELGLDLLDYPDLERAMSLKNAAVDNIMEVLEKIVSEGVYDTPEIYMDLNAAIALGQGMYLKARNDNVSEERQDLLRRFIDDCNHLKNQASQVDTAMATPAPNSAAAVPEAPPVSQLMPNAPGVVQ